MAFFVQEPSRSSLLVMDLGHIAFRRDEETAGTPAVHPYTPGDSDIMSPALNASSSWRGSNVPQGGDVITGDGTDDPLDRSLGVQSSNVGDSDWRLDISGVQVCVWVCLPPEKYLSSTSQREQMVACVAV